MLNKDDKIRLFACCIPVKGTRRSLICDTQRESIHLIPNSLYELIAVNSSLIYAKLIEGVDHEHHATIYEYLTFLIENELAFVTESPHLFPQMRLDWKSPNQISNCIVDMKDDYTIWYIAINQLISLSCQHIQLRIFSKISFEDLCSLLEKLDKSPIRSIEIMLGQCDWINTDTLNEINKKYSRIFSLVVFDATISDDKNLHQEMGRILFIPENLHSSLHCGKIHSSLFNINIPTFTESHHHNSCLNRKISIDTEGNIKNCPSMSQSFGNIRDTTLQQALDHPDFKKYWNITKDQIEVCKDCEFRYICTDCRAYIENPDDMYSKPLKCGYNPYTCEWEEWSTNPLKQKAIDYYGMREVLPEFQLKPDFVPPAQAKNE
ncbi:MAG TPA: grasp-with-spasm system SPASM domain peptide maturase [Saprospiraceae bacterium]|jgi:SPASM domain peptide maturase of grasp-with-spasm system|nr:grasp-with-spasm system SPASM domain peptide maturase [Saprospiraceae bacterium]HPI05585.1 grasp-with-spasm system SPASM domain peptide maturase [Saprospiraceae bacterium]